jgi:aspartate ammonia-lyase
MAERGSKRGRRATGAGWMEFDGPVRTERDRLGEREVPAEALWGIQTLRSLENLSFSSRPLGSQPAYVWGLGAVKRAAVRANREAGVLMPHLAEALDTATLALLDGQHLDQFPADLLGGGGSIGVHVNVNEVLANLANERLGAKRGEYAPVSVKLVSASQSTADVCHTGARLALLRQWGKLSTALDGAIKTLSELARELNAVPTLSRTCLQDAVTTTLGVLFGGYASAMQRRTAEVAAGVAPLHQIALGGTVIGTSDGAPVAYRKIVVPALAEISGFDLEPRLSLPDAMQNSDDLASLSAQLRLLAETLIKIAKDLRLLASGPNGGFGEILLPHVQEGSSFFSGKSNPVVAETVLQGAFQVIGCDRAVQAAMEQSELYLNVFDGLIAVNLLEAFELLSQMVRRLDERCLRGLKADEARCSALAKLGS